MNWKFPRFNGHILLTEDVSNAKNCSTEKNLVIYSRL